MANTTSTTKKASAKATAPATEVKLNSFVGVMYHFTPVQGSTDRICWFDTLNAKKTDTIEFPARLTDDKKYLADYIKEHTVLEVTVKELPEVEGKRQFEIVSMHSETRAESKRVNLNALLGYEERKVKA